MSRKSLIAVVAGLALALPSTGSAATVGLPTAVRTNNEEIKAAASELGAGYARALGLPARALKQSSGASAGYVFPALDFNEDGTRDLIGAAIDYEGGRSTFQALDGTDGETLFTRMVDGYAFPFPVPVGEDGTPGMLVFSLSSTGGFTLVGGAALIQTSVTAVDGSGTDLWTRSLDGVYVESLLLTLVENYGAGTAVFNGIEGDAADPILVMASGRYDPVTYDFDYEMVVLDGRDGSTVYERPLPGWRLDLRPTVDLDEDGLDDYVRFGKKSGRRVVEAVDGSTLETLWGPVPLGRGSRVRPVGDFNGDGTSELMVSGSRYGGGGHIYLGSDRYYGGFGGSSTTTLLDGRKGRALWTQKAGSLFLAGDVDRNGTRDFGLQTFHAGDKKRGVSYSAMDWRGKELFSTFYGETGDTEAAFQKRELLANLGDIDGDGVQDSYHSLAFVDFESERFFSHEGFVSGRDGGKIREGDPHPPLRASLDGNGDDFFEIKRGRTSHTVRITDGSDGSTLWERSLFVPKRRTGTFLTPFRGQDGTTDLLVNLITYTRSGYLVATYLLDGGSGKTIWSRG